MLSRIKFSIAAHRFSAKTSATGEAARTRSTCPSSHCSVIATSLSSLMPPEISRQRSACASRAAQRSSSRSRLPTSGLIAAYTAAAIFRLCVAGSRPSWSRARRNRTVGALTKKAHLDITSDQPIANSTSRLKLPARNGDVHKKSRLSTGYDVYFCGAVACTTHITQRRSSNGKQLRHLVAGHLVLRLAGSIRARCRHGRHAIAGYRR